MEELKLSIALITYNHEGFIAGALKSILDQQVNFKYEIVVGEDYSTDNTRAIIKTIQEQYPGIIRLIDRGRNVGSTINFNDTLKQCRGEFIAMLDGDDYMLPGKLQKQVDFLDQHSDFVMVAHDLRAFDNETGATVRIVKPPVIKEYYTIEDLFIYSSIFGNSSKMFRRSALPAYGVSPKIHFIADLFITLHIVKESKIGYIRETLGDYRLHSGGMMRNLKGKEAFEDVITTIDSITEIYGDKYKPLYRNQIAYAFLIYGIDEVYKGHLSAGRNQLIESIKVKWNFAPSQYFYLMISVLPESLRGKLITLKQQLVKRKSIK